MKKRMIPLILCVVLVLSAVASGSVAFASDAGAAPYSDENGDIDSGGDDSSANTGMFTTTAALGKTFMSGLWSLFGIYVPGFSFTFGQMWLGVLLASISILVVRMIFGFGGGRASGEATRTSSTNNAKISKERRNDEY